MDQPRQELRDELNAFCRDMETRLSTVKRQQAKREGLREGLHEAITRAQSGMTARVPSFSMTAALLFRVSSRPAFYRSDRPDGHAPAAYHHALAASPNGDGLELKGGDFGTFFD